MSDGLRGVVVCHGNLAQALIDAVHQISGLTDGLVPVSNRDCDRDALERRIVDAVAGQPAVLFVDMASGSCLFAVLHRVQSLPGVRVVTGVNLAMLLDFMFHRSLAPDAAAARAVETGGQAIRVP